MNQNERLIQNDQLKKGEEKTYTIKHSLYSNQRGSIFKYYLGYDEEFPYELKGSVSEEQYHDIISKLKSFSTYYQPQNIYLFVIFSILFWCIIPTSISMTGVFIHLFIYYIIIGFFTSLIIASYIYAFGIKISNYVRNLNSDSKDVKYEYRKAIPFSFFILFCYSVQFYVQLLLVTKSEKEENYGFLLSLSSIFLFIDVLGIAFFIRHIILISSFSCRGGRVETDHINYLNGITDYYAKPYSFLITYQVKPNYNNDEFDNNNNSTLNNLNNSYDNNNNNNENNINNYNNSNNNYTNNNNYNNYNNYNNNYNNYNNNNNNSILVDTSSDDPFSISTTTY